jgi:hypothetical protein
MEVNVGKSRNTEIESGTCFPPGVFFSLSCISRSLVEGSRVVAVVIVLVVVVVVVVVVQVEVW